MEPHSASRDQVRAAEIIGATCLATDLGMGFPFEHGFHATLMTMKLVELLGVDSDTASQTYFACLLMYSGCTTDADVAVRTFGGGLTEHTTPKMFGSPLEGLAGVVGALPSPDSPPYRRALEVVQRLPRAARHRKPHMIALCEVATMLADRLGLPPAISGLFTYLTERWDGNGALNRAHSEEIPLPLRIVHVARDAAYQQLVGGVDHAAEVIRQRAGHAFDPAIAHLFADRAAEVVEAGEVPGSAWDATLAAEPPPWLVLDGTSIDRALAAIGNFADLVSPFLAGHSAGVARLTEDAADRCGFGPADIRLVRRAALIHDVGRVAVHPRIWQKPATLTADEWEKVRLHAYHTERVLSRTPFLAALGSVAGAHHERIDGSGYHRNLPAASLAPASRLVAAADAFHAMTEPRPHRSALSVEEAGQVLMDQTRAGRHDPDIVAAVFESAGRPVPRLTRPGDLTERESEVIGLVARGLQTKQVARVLDISAKTVDTHIQNAYRKIGVSTRAAATLFAMEHGLLASGELPIPGQHGAS